MSGASARIASRLDSSQAAPLDSLVHPEQLGPGLGTTTTFRVRRSASHARRRHVPAGALGLAGFGSLGSLRYTPALPLSSSPPTAPPSQTFLFDAFIRAVCTWIDYIQRCLRCAALRYCCRQPAGRRRALRDGARHIAAAPPPLLQRRPRALVLPIAVRCGAVPVPATRDHALRCAAPCCAALRAGIIRSAPIRLSCVRRTCPVRLQVSHTVGRDGVLYC
ncbi:hypothetical protein P171DRAFT_56934 [Karstenula rhodostoma CBS 690.94]|uniref:Uncharacterized protein n=1 Tax=Karstenula rhodostoma CBS 690.94 TaxID=1392251 RepID=A0A9P4PFQ2_9PLEO|nr:hypothetical protein P171DRAFT_56934 [Karstenula rhodostoma CBS 690.94]